MNPLTNVRNITAMNEKELQLGYVNTNKSWHRQYKDSAWIFIGGLNFELTEGDVICVFSQFGEVVNIDVIRDPKTGKSRGFAFLCYEDQRSTILAVDNLNGVKVAGRIVRVDHVENYKPPKGVGAQADGMHKWEGCAPEVMMRIEGVQPPTVEVEAKAKQEKEKKRKKKEKKKKKKKKMAESSESDSSESSVDDTNQPSTSQPVSRSPQDATNETTDQHGVPRNGLSSQHDRYSSTRDRRPSPRDRRFSPRERRSSPRDRQPSPRDRRFVLRDRRPSPHDRRFSPRDRRLSPRDRRFSPRDRRFSPRDRRLSPRDRRFSPRDRRSSPRDRSGKRSPKERRH